MLTDIPMCCFIDGDKPCENPAEWQISYGPTVDDYTEACTAHVGELLELNAINTVYPIEPESPK